MLDLHHRKEFIGPFGEAENKKSALSGRVVIRIEKRQAAVTLNIKGKQKKKKKKKKPASH